MNINFDFMSNILKSWENRCLRVYGKATVRKKLWHLNTPTISCSFLSPIKSCSNWLNRPFKVSFGFENQQNLEKQ